MREMNQLYYATNREIRDLLLSAKQRITENVLHELLRDRGIFCSPQDSREALVDRLSMLTHDYADVCGILERSDSSKRNEKISTMTIPLSLTPSELKEIVEEYQKDEPQEAVRHHQRGANGFVMDVGYAEFDYSKTRLLQREDRNATIEFQNTDGKVEVRLPATDKARTIVDKLKVRIEEKKKQKIELQEIELTSLSSAEDKTTFFTNLISSLPQFSLENVSRLQVAHADGKSSNDLDMEDDEEVGEAAAQMLGVVKNVALSGENLVASEMYQELKRKGFFITSITWLAKQSVDPYSKVEFDAGFEDKQAGKKFRYSVRGAFRFKNGAYNKSIRPVSDNSERAELLGMIEGTARKVLAELLAKANATDQVCGEVE